MITLRSSTLIAVCLALAGCGDGAARSPSPTVYTWPERISWRMETVSELQRNRQMVQRFEVHKILRLGVRDRQYILGYDSVLRLTILPDGQGGVAPFMPEDTLGFYLDLDDRGFITELSPGCDPALPACAEVLPSSVAMELRRVIPRIPLWEVPRGSTWTDTLTFDDARRTGGARGTFVTTYGPVRDTTIGSVAYWMVPWRDERRAYRIPALGQGIAPEQPVQESGLTLIDKARLLPVFSTWSGAVAAPAQLRAAGIDASGFHARAYLVNSPFDSAFAGPARQ